VQGRGILRDAGAGVRLAGLLMVCVYQVPSKKLLRHLEAEELGIGICWYADTTGV
jgi:hypothetical protein